MIFSMILAGSLLNQAASQAPVSATSAPVTLARVFTANEKQAYEIKAHLKIESRQAELTTWIPEDLDISYGFTTQVTAMKSDGIAVLHYLRPTMTQAEGETFEGPGKTTVEKVNGDMDLTVTPLNEVIDHKDRSKKAKTPKAGAGWTTALSTRQALSLKQFTGDIIRLSVFIGPIEGGLDFSPRFPLDPVKVGDTWKRTVGYAPQKLKGKAGKQAVQRLDYVYTYKGVVQSNGKQVIRVEAKLVLNNDIAPFINDLIDSTPEESGLKKFDMKLTGIINYDLDLKTRTTLSAIAHSDGGFKIYTTESSDPIEEAKLKGDTTLTLVGSRIIKSGS